MLEGLEITEATKTSLTEILRLDSDFNSKENKRLFKILEKNHLISLGKATNYITDMGAFSLYNSKFFQDSGIPFLRVNNVKDNFLDLSETLYISPEYHNELQKSHLLPRDVLLTTKAIIGLSCTIPDDIGECNMSQNLVRMGMKSEFNSYFVSTFLNSKYGLMQTNRLATGNVQLYLNFENIKKLNIPLFSSEFQLNIEQVVVEGYRILKVSRKLYDQAETILLEELGGLWFGSRPDSGKIVTAVKTLKDSFEDSGRLDAEYYQPKFDKIEEILTNNGEYRLSDHYKIIRSKNYSYVEAGDVDVIKTKQVKKGAINFDFEDCTTSQIVKDDKLPVVQDNDLVFASMGKGSMGKVSLFYSYQHDRPLTIDSTLRIFRQKDDAIINSESLLVLINSDFYQEYILKYEIGSTGITSLYEDDINNLLIPKLSAQIQKTIKEKVQESFKLRKQSKALLEAAKTAVEIAIEQNEEEAIKYLENLH